MCNSNGDDGNNYLESRPKMPVSGTECRKCRTQRAQVVLQISDAYCRECFLALCSHKFRGILGRSRVLHSGEDRQVVIACSGGAGSLALLKLMQEAVDPSQAHRRLLALPSVLYVDDGAVAGQNLQQREDQCLFVLSQARAAGLKAFVVPLTLGEVVAKEITESGNVTQSDEKVAALLDALPDLSSKLDMLQRLRHSVLAAASRGLGADKILLGDNATSLAAKILTCISLGRGAQVPLETGFVDDREDKMVFLRPLRDFSCKEVAFFNVFHGLHPSSLPSLLTQTQPDDSIHRLAEDFVMTLQRDFPSTVPTVYRTGDKLEVQPGESCALCQAPRDTDPRACSAMEATQFSRSLSSAPPAGLCETPPPSACLCQTPKQDNCQVGTQNVLAVLCYSCRLLASSMDSVSHLPASVLAEASRQASLGHMKAQIQEFLLE